MLLIFFLGSKMRWTLSPARFMSMERFLGDNINCKKRKDSILCRFAIFGHFGLRIALNVVEKRYCVMHDRPVLSTFLHISIPPVGRIFIAYATTVSSHLAASAKVPTFRPWSYPTPTNGVCCGKKALLPCPRGWQCHLHTLPKPPCVYFRPGASGSIG